MKKILNWIFAGLLAFGICGTAVTSLIAAETRQSEIAASLITADGVTVVSESDAAKAYTGDERKGLFLSASESGSGIAFTDEFSGTFACFIFADFCHHSFISLVCIVMRQLLNLFFKRGYCRYCLHFFSVLFRARKQLLHFDILFRRCLPAAVFEE